MGFLGSKACEQWFDIKKGAVMGMQCAVTGKKPVQRIKIDVNGTIKTVRVAVSAIRSGLVKRAVKRKPFQMPNL